MYTKKAKNFIEKEIKALKNLTKKINNNFDKLIDVIRHSNGKIVITGIGKSGLIAKKIVATLVSTGTPSIFLHAGEAMHGDLGFVQKNDIVILISYSGETQEVVNLVPALKKLGVKQLIAITGRPRSRLAKLCNLTLDIGVRKEADPLNLAPTSSTTATLALGDAIALTLANLRHWKSKDFAKFHPGGSLGKRLLNKK